MMRGRPPSWNPFGDLEPGAWTEVVFVSSKERITLPAAVRGRLPWFDAAVTDGLLVILEPQGRAELTAWASRGARAVADASQRIEAAPPEERADFAIAAMDRYMRISIEPPARVALHANLAAHLETAGARAIRVVVGADRLWLWSERQWQVRRMDRIALLAPTDT